MLTYRRFLTESVGSTKRVAEEDISLQSVVFNPSEWEDTQYIWKGSVYYLDENGLLHREDGPAVEDETGNKLWCIHGKSHRLDGPAIIWPHDATIWCKDDMVHREDGPAIIQYHHRYWWLFDKSITDRSSDEDKWKILKGDPESIEVFPNSSTKEMQEYLLKVRPDLIGTVNNLDPGVAEKYRHEVELSHVDL